MDGLKISIALVSSILLLLTGAYGLDFSMGASNGLKGASEKIKLDAPLDGSLYSRTVASPESHATSMTFKGSGAYDFNQTFFSLSKDEQVNLNATMQDSKGFIHSYEIEKQEKDRIRVSQSLDVDQGKFIECYTESLNSMGQAARVGLKIEFGSLNNYQSYGDASDEMVVADQMAVVPAKTRVSVFAEAEREISTQKSKGFIFSSKALDVKTTATVTEKKSKISSAVSKSKDYNGKDDDGKDKNDKKE